MNTKLVYVLTCAPEATYIEQALMAVWSARQWNPDAHIVLMVDDKTDALLTGKRGEILNYISEKIVVPFEDEALTPMYRSRWIKTQVRQLIKGDFLFVDSDTICQRPLSDIDGFDCEVGAVLESHLPVVDFCDSLHKAAKNLCATIEVDIDEEQYYFSSGVLFVKDTKQTHRLYELWHQYWKEGIERGLKIDQPSLSKANREIGHIIGQISDTYNCIIFTQPTFVREAYILHIASYCNPSFLFTESMLKYVRVHGLQEAWLQECILTPYTTMLPFDYNVKYSSCKQRRLWRKEIAHSSKMLYAHISEVLSQFPMQSRLRSFVVWCMTHGMYQTGASLWLMIRRLSLRRKNNIHDNICKK